ICNGGVSRRFRRIKPDGEECDCRNEHAGKRNDPLDANQIVFGGQRAKSAMEVCNRHGGAPAPAASMRLACCNETAIAVCKSLCSQPLNHAKRRTDGLTEIKISSTGQRKIAR